MVPAVRPEVSMLNRRTFISTSAAAAAALATQSARSDSSSVPPLPDAALYHKDEKPTGPNCASSS